jgi:16S rRNA (cytosine1402-N4)-methyltransferase
MLRVITKKPVAASPAEVRRNPRARSARLRAAERCGDPAFAPVREST